MSKKLSNDPQDEPLDDDEECDEFDTTDAQLDAREEREERNSGLGEVKWDVDR